jgi:hypothetical protein
VVLFLKEFVITKFACLFSYFNNGPFPEFRSLPFCSIGSTRSKAQQVSKLKTIIQEMVASTGVVSLGRAGQHMSGFSVGHPRLCIIWKCCSNLWIFYDILGAF